MSLTPHIHPSTPGLQVSTQPLPGDVTLTVRVQPGAALGMVDVRLSAGRGRGNQSRTVDDAGYVAAVRKIAAHLTRYAADYEAALLADDGLPF